MLDDVEWLDPIVERVRSGQPPKAAVLAVSEEIASELGDLDDPYLKERAADIRDLAKRLARALSGRETRQAAGSSVRRARSCSPRTS